MEQLNQFKIYGATIPELTFVGAAVFFEFYTTKVYVDSNGEIYIKEWVDVSEDRTVNRFFYYNTSKLYLKAFLDGRISPLELIRRATSTFYTFVDEVEGGKVLHSHFLLFKEIPEEYLPDFDAEILDSDFVHRDVIYSKLNLNQIEDESIYSINTEFSIQHNSNIVNLHIREGEGVGFGTADASKLGRALIGFETLYENIARDAVFGNKRTKNNTFKKSEVYSVGNTELDVVGFAAASFSVLMKPKTDIFGLDKSFSDDIFEKAFGLISDMKDIKIDEAREHFSPYTIEAFTNFNDVVYKEKLKIDVETSSIQGNDIATMSFSYQDAFKIKEVLDLKEIKEVDDVEIIGKFIAVNCKTGSFNFIDNEDNDYRGSFSKQILESAYDVNFHKLYHATLKRTITDKKGEGLKTTYEMLGYYPDSGDAAY